MLIEVRVLWFRFYFICSEVLLILLLVFKGELRLVSWLNGLWLGGW